MTNFKNFLRDDAGSVTIDWVALTAGVLLLGIMVVYGIFSDGVAGLATQINTNLDSAGSSATVQPSDLTAPSQTAFGTPAGG